MVPLVPKAATEVPEDEDPRRVALQLDRLVRSGGTVVQQVYDAVIAMGYKAKLPPANSAAMYLRMVDPDAGGRDSVFYLNSTNLEFATLHYHERVKNLDGHQDRTRTVLFAFFNDHDESIQQTLAAARHVRLDELGAKRSPTPASVCGLAPHAVRLHSGEEPAGGAWSISRT